jgi:predicted Zn-dependent protease
MRTLLFILIVAAASAHDDTQIRKETAVGAQLAQEVRRRTTAIENPAVQDYVEGIGRAANEAELAGMLAHAMAHVTLPRPQVDGATIPLVFLGGWQGFGPGRDSLVPMSLLKTQRDNELRADAIAIQAMSESGYDPMDLARYLERLPRSRGTTSVFAALPDPDARIAAMGRAISELPARAYPPTNPDELDGIQEQVRNAVPPMQNRSRPTLKRPN